MLLSALGRWPGRPSAARRRPPALRVEPLEDRLALAGIVVLSNANALFTFDSATPGVLDTGARITGLRPGERVLAIDSRPATGELYGLTTQSRLYTLDPFTGAATRRATLAADPADTTSRFTRLAGTRFSIDFNPADDRLRVVSELDQNLRVDVDTGRT
ncbi:MAG: DUF4394 domain-containing protein, partial [Gemmataceae bacterium]